MKTSISTIVALMSVFCFVSIKAIEVYAAGRDGKPIWQESPAMRDRSIVPTPSPADMAADYSRRSRIPFPIAPNYRTRLHSIPRPSADDIIMDYRRRSRIPFPIAPNYRTRSHSIPRSSANDIIMDYRRRSRIPVPRTINRAVMKLPYRRATINKKSLIPKKNLIDRIFFTLPFGAQFPIFFTWKSTKKGNNKKSDVAVPGQRHRAPFRLHTWGLPVHYRALANKRFLMPYIEQQAIARQRVTHAQGGLTSLRRNRGYYAYSPRSFFASPMLNNRNSIPYLYQRNRSYTVPRSQHFLNRIARSSKPFTNLKKTKTKEEEQSRKAVINREFS